VEGSKNLADGPSRWPDHEISYERPASRLLATVSVEPYDYLIAPIIAAQASDPFAADVSAKLVDLPIIEGSATAKEASQWKVVAGVSTYEGMIYVPAVDSLCGKEISLFHDNPESSHFGAIKTTELVSRNFYWPVMDLRVCTYVSGCEVCH